MPSLGEYIGRLIADVAVGRAQADLESARLAQYYRADPLLRYLSAPRFVVSKVDFSVPVAVVDVSIKPLAAAVTLDETMAILRRALDDELSSLNIVLDQGERDAVAQRLDRAQAELAQDIKSQDSTVYVINVLSAAATEALPARLGKPTSAKSSETPLDAISAALPAMARGAALAAEFQAAGVQVQVTAAELQGAAAGSLLNISLSLTEEGLQWHEDESGDGRLLPE